MSAHEAVIEFGVGWAKVHFRRDITDRDREAITAAVRALEAGDAQGWDISRSNALDVTGLSADTDGAHILRLHFRRDVTEEDRGRLVDAINQYRRASPPTGEEWVPRRLLNERDDFIVNEGLWSKFMDSLPSGSSQEATEKKP